MTLRDDALIFINYRQSDARWAADAFAEKLKAAFGEDRVFLDVRDIGAGDDWRAELDEKLRRTAVFLVIIGRDWLVAHDEYGRRRIDQRSDWVHREIRTALKNEHCRIVPVQLDDAVLPEKKEALPGALRGLLKPQRITVRSARKDDDLEALCKEIEKAGFRRVAPPPVEHAPQDAAGEPIDRRLPLKDVDAELAVQIGRGKLCREEVVKWLRRPGLDPDGFRSHSVTWHAWRRALEFTTIPALFMRPADLLTRLRRHRIEHMDLNRPWKTRGRALLRDWSRDLEFLEDLRYRLPTIYDRHRTGP